MEIILIEMKIQILSRSLKFYCKYYCLGGITLDWNSFMEGSKNLSVFALALRSIILCIA